MREKDSQTPHQEVLEAITDRFVATAQAIIDKHGVRTENDGFEGPFNAPLRRINIATQGVSDNFDMILARVRKQQDCHRELTSEELQAWEEDEAEARRNHVPPSLRDKPSNDQVGTLNKEGYVIEASHDGGHQWEVYFAVKTVDFGEPVKIDNDQVEGVSRAREHRLETLKKISEALDRQAVEKQQQG